MVDDIQSALNSRWMGDKYQRRKRILRWFSQRSFYFMFFVILMCLELFIFTRTEPVRLVFLVCAIITLLVLSTYKRTWGLFFVCFTIAFPIHIRIMDHDAFTITTVLIILFFSLEVFKGNIEFNKVGKAVFFFIFIFFLANTLSLLQLRGSELFINMRPYMGFLSALMLFYLVVNIIKTTHEFNGLLVIIYVFLITQLVISLLVISKYDMRFLAIFATRQNEFWITTHRAAGLIHDYELLAEWYAVFIPFALWLLFTKGQKWLHALGVILLLIGIVVTATRGAFLSLAVGVLVFLFFIPGKTIRQRAKYFFATLSVIIASWFIIGLVAKDFRERFVDRFDAAVVSYQRGSSLTEVMNRKEIWDSYIDKHLAFALIGTGQRDATMGNLHSLYFTLLYQTGLLGLLSFVGLLIAIIIQLIHRFTHSRDLQQKLIIALSLSALIIFIIDEIKIEYTRSAYCMQYAWLCIALMMTPLCIKENGYLSKPMKMKDTQ